MAYGSQVRPWRPQCIPRNVWATKEGTRIVYADRNDDKLHPFSCAHARKHRQDLWCKKKSTAIDTWSGSWNPWGTWGGSLSIIRNNLHERFRYSISSNESIMQYENFRKPRMHKLILTSPSREEGYALLMHPILRLASFSFNIEWEENSSFLVWNWTF